MLPRGVVRSGGKGKAELVTIAFLALVMSLFTSSSASAQAVGATLSGTVTDASGAVISGAEISIKDLGTGVTRTLTSDSAGYYSAPNLLPATYSVTTTATGFSTNVQTGITLSVGAQQQLNISMKVGESNH